VYMSGCRGPIDDDRDDPPRIFVRCLGAAEPDAVSYVEHGIEEEGVSWVVQLGFEGDGVAVAQGASDSSPLKIGVSVDDDGRIVVHHEQLPAEEPLFDVADVTEEAARSLGANSARLAKGTPLKPIA